ncbi:MAG: DUF4422 domain-containing protein [Eubacteriales bacterium]
MKNLTLYAVTHKDGFCRLPDRTYIGVGRNRAIPGVTLYDDAGENISSRNPSFCELTVLYWIWKNDSSDAVGLEHYRRYFYHKFRSVFRYRFYTKEELAHLLTKYDIIVPEKSYMKMKKDGVLARTVGEHFALYHHAGDLEITRQVVSERAPAYLDAFDRVMAGKTLSLFNIFAANKSVIDAYTAWLFDILFEVEKRVDISGYDTQQTRLFGFLSERLFNVWLAEQKNLRVKYLPICGTEEKPFRAFAKKVGKTVAFWRR